MPPTPAFLFLTLTPGAAGGFLFVAVAFRLSASGAPVARTALLIACFLLVQTVRLGWAPLIDSTATRAWWYVVGWTLCVTNLLVLALVPPGAWNLPSLLATVLAMSIGAATMSTATEGLVATIVPPRLRGEAGGWLWGGLLGGQALGGGVGLWLLQHAASPFVAAMALAAIFASCMLPIHRLTAGGRDSDDSWVPPVRARLVDAVRELITFARSPSGLVALAAALVPLGAGAAASLWAAVAPDWGASADTVAGITGASAPLCAAIGSIMGGRLSHRVGARRGYVFTGVALAAAVLVMAIAPRTPATYIGFTLLYQAVLGGCYGTFPGLVLTAGEIGGASTRGAAYFGLATMPVWYMTLVEGWAHDRLGVTGMLSIDGLAALAGLVVLAAVAHGTGTRLLTDRRQANG